MLLFYFKTGSMHSHMSRLVRKGSFVPHSPKQMNFITLPFSETSATDLRRLLVLGPKSALGAGFGIRLA